MKRPRLLSATLTFALLAVPLFGSTAKCTTCARTSKKKIKRSGSAKKQFQAEHPCPGTGRTTGGCKGYVIDHVMPLACGGGDNPGNMQWQTKSEAKAKDKVERTGCK